MHGIRLFAYAVLGLLIASSIFVAMPGLFGGLPGSPKDDGPALPANQYRLGLGDAKLLRGVQFKFKAIESDSRCAADQICSGDNKAVVTLEVTEAGSVEDLSVDSQNMTNISGFNIRLVGLTPRPAPHDGPATAIFEFIDATQQ